MSELLAVALALAVLLAAAPMLLVILMGTSQSALTTLTKLAMVLLFAGLGALGVLVLTLKDAVQRKTDRGDRMSYLTRLYFWKGGWSYAVWFLTVFVLAFVLTTALCQKPLTLMRG